MSTDYKSLMDDGLQLALIWYENTYWGHMLEFIGNDIADEFYVEGVEIRHLGFKTEPPKGLSIWVGRRTQNKIRKAYSDEVSELVGEYNRLTDEELKRLAAGERVLPPMGEESSTTKEQ